MCCLVELYTFSLLDGVGLNGDGHDMVLSEKLFAGKEEDDTIQKHM